MSINRNRRWRSGSCAAGGLEAQRRAGDEHRLRVLLLLQLLGFSRRHRSLQDRRPRHVHRVARAEATRRVGRRAEEEEQS